MRAIWSFRATIATPLVVSPPLLAKEKDPALTSPTPALPAAPVAEKRPHEMTLHGKTLSDPYHWLKDESYPVIDDKDVLDYVKAENAYFDAAMKPHAALVEKIGRAHVCTPVTNAHLVCRLLLDKKNQRQENNTTITTDDIIHWIH